VHDNRGDVGLCPACEAASNKSYTNDLMSDAYLVGEYQRRIQAGVDAEIARSMGLPEDNHGPTERAADPVYDVEGLA
jgi:hypothetical protein